MGNIPAGTTPVVNQTQQQHLGLATALANGYVRAGCGQESQPGYARCLSYVLTKKGAQAYGINVSAPARKSFANHRSVLSDNPWLEPSDIQSAYGLTSLSATAGSGRIVAVVDAGNDPYIESDLAVFRSYWGFPSCTTSNGCFQKVGQDGTTYNLPGWDSTQNVTDSNSGDWALEEMIDVDMVSIVCPNCHIMVVEANSNYIGDLAAAVDTAVRLGAFAVSNSYAVPETGQSGWASHYNHVGAVITAGSGDWDWNGSTGYGMGPSIPASFSTVIAVGSTTLYADSSARGWHETVWEGTANGCSKIIAKPSWQHDSGCSMRTTADVAFVGSTDSYVWAYGHDDGDVGWIGVSGTSVASPAIAALFALTGYAPNDASSLYTNVSELNDITSGSTGTLNGNGTCVPASPQPQNNGAVDLLVGRHVTSGDASYLCNGKIGFDGPSGNGSPNGPNGFIGPLPTCTLPPSSTPNPHPTQSTRGGCTS